MTQIDQATDTGVAAQVEPLPPVDDKARQQAISDLQAKRDALVAQLVAASDAEIAAIEADPEAAVPDDATKLASVAAVVPDFRRTLQAITAIEDAAAAFKTYVGNQATLLRQSNDNGDLVTVPSLAELFKTFSGS